jgi:hypothetical protein
MTAHMVWLADTGTRISTKDGRQVEVWTLACDSTDVAAWSDWAKHFRSHYCQDSMIDALKAGTKHENSRGDFLREMVFPDSTKAPGPSIRAGDFAEILIADLLQYEFGYLVPRTRYASKSVRNESVKGSDIIGMKFANPDESPCSEDELLTCEAKAQFSGDAPKARLQDAADDSIKDQYRKAETLNATKQRLILEGRSEEVARVQRFQNPIDNPYCDTFGAAALFSSSVFDPETIAKTDCAEHPSDRLRLIVLHAEDFMQIVNRVYGLAADEA